MDRFKNELMGEPDEEEVEGYDLMNDLTFGGDMCDGTDGEDWEAQHEKLAGEHRKSILGVDPGITPSDDRTGYPDDLYYGGYDVELEQKVSELVVDEDEDDDCINDDDDAINGGLGGEYSHPGVRRNSKSGPKRITNLGGLFGDPSLQGLFHAEDLVNGQPNIWGSPAEIDYLTAMAGGPLAANSTAAGFPPSLQQLNNSFPGTQPNFMQLGMMPGMQNNMLHGSPISGGAATPSSSSRAVPRMMARLPAGRAMTLEDLEKELLNGSSATTNNSSNKPAAVKAEAAAEQSMTAVEIEKSLRDTLMGGQAVGGGTPSDFTQGEDLLSHPGVLHLPPRQAELMSFQNTLTSNIDRASPAPIGSRLPLRYPSNTPTLTPGSRMPVGGGFGNVQPPFPGGFQHLQQLGRQQQYMERQQLPMHPPHHLLMQQQQLHLQRQHMQRPPPPPFFPGPPGLLDVHGMPFNPPPHPAALRNLSSQQLHYQQLQQQQQLQQHMQLYHQRQQQQQMQLNIINMQRMKGNPAVSSSNGGSSSSSGSFPLQQQQRFQQLQMMKQRGGAYRQLQLSRGGDSMVGGGAEDIYAGLMEQREKDWIIKIQLLQLQTDNPYVDDYYYTVWSLKKIMRERQKKEGIQKQGGGVDELTLVLPQLAKLDNRSYMPVQFEGSLGRLTTASIHCPRQMIDLHKQKEEEEEGQGQQGSTGAEQQDEVKKRQEQRRLKLTLLSIEKGYMSLLHIEDAEKKAMALPPENRSAINEERSNLISTLYTGLRCDDLASPVATVVTATPFLQYLSVRKGAILVARLLRLVNKVNAKVMMVALMSRLSQVTRKDWQDEVWPRMYQSMSLCIQSADLSSLVSYVQQLTGDKQQQQLSVLTLPDDKNLHNNILSLIQHRLGVSIIVSLLTRAEVVYQSVSPLDLDAEDQRYWRVFVETVASVIDGAEKGLVAPSVTNCDLAVSHLRRVLTDELLILSVREKLSSIL